MATIIGDELIPIMDEMLMDLSTNKLEVCLIPSQIEDCAKDGGMIRVAYNQNVDWYRKLCECYSCTRYKKRNPRKDYTKIKRANIIYILSTLIKNGKSRSKYAEDLRDIAIEIKDMYDKLENNDEEEMIPWKNQF